MLKSLLKLFCSGLLLTQFSFTGKTVLVRLTLAMGSLKLINSLAGFTFAGETIWLMYIKLRLGFKNVS